MKTKSNNWPRLIIQWGILSFILLLAFFPQITGSSNPDFEAYCPFGGLQALGSYLLNQALSCTMTSAQIVMGVLLFAGVLAFSKLFCAFICPIGTVSEALGNIGARFKIRFTIEGIADKILRSLKYVLLFITLYFTLQSNELFCKKFDPYFALASGFNADVVVLYSLLSIAIVIIGSLFIRLFWCKYICPLGAISNIFKFSIFFVASLGVYLILLHFGATVSYVWPLAIACSGGYFIELLGQKSKYTPLAKITRNTETCTNCTICTKKCPQGIDVASVLQVKHVDCNLCGDCLLACPEKNTLSINKKPAFKRLPVIATVVLVVAGILMGNVWEVPTIDIRWGEPDEMETAGIFTQSGLSNMKCYGSSMAFANKMREYDGILGVATFVKNKRVKIYYDTDKLNEEKIQQMLFTPQKNIIAAINQEMKTIHGLSLKLENFFDSYDFSYLNYLLRENTDAVGLLSEFDCPVIVKIYFTEEVKDYDHLAKLIETKEMTIETNNGPSTVELDYEIIGDAEFFTISQDEYLKTFFTPFERTFNFRNTYSSDVVSSFEFPLGTNKKLRGRLSYLVSHLSNNDGIVEFVTHLDENNQEIAEISYVDTMISIKEIETEILADSLYISFSDGRTGKVKNMFDFSTELQTLEKK